MKSLSKGPSSEGPKGLSALGRAKSIAGLAALALGLATASTAAAQYTVEAGKSVVISIPAAGVGDVEVDGPRTDFWSGTSSPSKGTISYNDTSGYATSGVYTANANASGSDSFSWAWRCGATSGSPYPCGGGGATITIVPAKPSLTGGNLNIPYGSSGTHDFAPTNGGVLSLVQSPQNGGVMLSGGRATYTPNVNFAGSDTFGVTATNPGGTSAISIVSVYVTPPPVPVLTGGNLAVAYNAQAIHDFAPTNGGTVSLTTPPSHGTVSISDGKAYYMPSAGYIGPDSFGVRGSNVSGSSAEATVSVTVAPPPIPNPSGGSLSLAFNTPGSYTFQNMNGGTMSVVSPPTNGVLKWSFYRATYTPNADFVGTDSFTVTGTNAGGTSAPATVNITVAPPPIPVLTGGSLALAFNASGTHDFAPTSGGVLAVASAPAHGSVTISGGRATYTPNADYIGPDSFGVTGTNLGGTSAVSNVAVTVAPPPIPSLTGGSLALAFNTSGTHDFAPTERGVLALADAPEHGDVTINGGRVTYTPNTDYIGADSYSVTATNLGGTSAPVTASITVSPPAAPGAGSAALTTAYETVGRVLLPASGLFTSLAIVDQPQHGQVLITGNEATYTPQAGYFGADSFTYQAIGLGGSSGPASVAVTVGRPNAPVVANASAVTGHGAKVVVPLQVSGIYTSLRVDVPPNNGQATIDGLSVVYTPNGGFAGREIFTVVAEGPGGDSAGAEIAVSVDEPPPVEPPPPQKPDVKPAPVSLEGQAGSPMRFRVAAGLVGVTAVELVTQPSAGSAAVEQLDVVYAPPADFAGQVNFDYRLVTEQGPTTSATLTAVVHPPAAEAPVKEAVASPDEPGVVELTEGVANGPFSDAAIVSMSPASAGSAELVRGGQSAAMARSVAPVSAKAAGRASAAMAENANPTFQLKFKPAANFYGDVEIRYALTNRFGAPTTGVVRFLVDTREDPTRDPKVSALVNAQAQAAARFGDAQIGNVNRRLEAVRSGSAQAVAVSLSSARGGQTDEPFVDQSRGQMLAELRAATAPQADPAIAQPRAQRAGDKVQVWTGGAVVLGESRQRGGNGGFDFATAGISAGADVRLGEGLVVGAGAGYGRDRSDLGQGSKVESQALSAFGYASYKPNAWVFVDAVAGAARLDFDTERKTQAGSTLRGSRDGDELFGSVSVGLDLQADEWALSPYGRVQAVTATLGQYAETGETATALRFARHSVNQTTGVLGVVGHYRVELDAGVLEPTIRGEYHWSLRRSGVASLGYATSSGELPYQVMLSAFDDHRAFGAVGLRWITVGGWTFAVEVEGSTSDAGTTTGLRIGANGKF